MAVHPESAPEYRRALAESAAKSAPFTPLPMLPARRLIVLTCIDARISVEDALGIAVGDAHVIRNAGGLATDDAIRSMVISSTLLGTSEVIVLEHTDCGMLRFTDEDLHERLHRETGERLDFPFHAFADLDDNLRDQVARIREHPWTKDLTTHGLVYEVQAGRLRSVEQEG